ncbi:MAG: Superoxide dismutase [uncultured Sulfurovum sp.]|uniref:Superoxide dismutase n=1 Tax=uncultured Sulfurovum sp. TaxID=269237 RepID=A0A6S6SLT1_9BACT|nr:MAG: Superoxide dismutase [uncultured Sulfurovum sp.]
MKNKIKSSLLASAIMISGLSLLSTQTLEAHCQVPCGIYDDTARVNSMLEDAKTVAKATKLINELAGKTDAQSLNQITRWVLNKEKHAQNIIVTISDYFLTQRVKKSQKDYTERLTKHHAVILAAMKAKQLADTKSTAKLTATIEALAPYYMAKEHKKH